MSDNSKDLAQLAAGREQAIVRTSIIGIIANLFLAGFKAAVGLISNSIAVILDAVNNLSDALSSVITIIGTKLAGKLLDKKHPLGYGRLEYISSLIISALVLYSGITSLIESVKKIIHPEEADYSVFTLVVIGAAVIVKLLLGSYVKAQGKKLNSGTLVASGSDAFFDAILSASVFVSAIIFLIWGISLEAYVGVVIAIVIIKAGIELMLDTVNDILGQRADAELTKSVKNILTQEPDVRGAYDLLINNYGPNKNVASVHLELPDTMTVEQVDELTRRVETKVYKETGVILTGVGVYSYNTQDKSVMKIRSEVQHLVLSHDWVIQFHGFYVDIEKKTMRFDIVLDFSIDPKEAMATLYQEVQTAFPDYTVTIVPDVDLAD